MELVATCPRCGAKEMTFDVIAHYLRATEHQWKNWFEVFSVCRKCDSPTCFILGQKEVNRNPFERGFAMPSSALNNYFEIEGFVCLKDFSRHQPPEHVPKGLSAVFKEGATCLAVECFNAAGTMFRLCLDIATSALLPNPTPPGLDANTRRNLGKRIRWLLDNQLLPEALRELSTCVREDGNDGAHAGTLSKAEAEDLLDFTVALLERLYTEPKRLELAKLRRDARRKPLTAAVAKN